MRAIGINEAASATKEFGSQLFSSRFGNPRSRIAGMDGQQVISELRQWLKAPIIVLSARDQESHKIRALDNGADDYVTNLLGWENCWPVLGFPPPRFLIGVN